MQIKNLKLRNFRNYDHLDIEFNETLEIMRREKQISLRQYFYVRQEDPTEPPEMMSWLNMIPTALK